VSELRRSIRDNRDFVLDLLRRYLARERSFLLRSDLWEEFEALVVERGREDLRESPMSAALSGVQEAAIHAPWILLALRPSIGRTRYVRFHVEDLDYDDIDVADYLRFKERIVDGTGRNDRSLEIDLGPFNRDFPKLREPKSIGRGVEFLNRHLSSKLLRNLDNGGVGLLDFLRAHHVQGRPLMLGERIDSLDRLREALASAEAVLDAHSPGTGWSKIAPDLEPLGFLPGWGRNVSRVRSTMALLREILEAPDPRTLEKFLSRVPMIFSVVILSPHGWFGQSGVLGRPDTGGQVVYILEQVRALEEEMRRRIREQGLDVEPRIRVVTRLIPEADGTACDQPVEAIVGTRDAQILRVPFRRDSGEIVPQWISRFRIWPYLERFAEDVETTILADLGGRPDLILGNYSDGNLVASLLSSALGVTQCNIAHALEKTKYLFSDLYWKDLERPYHFSCQFTADLIAMNTADFIITSTYQEIAGRDESVGQYESYGAFTMPGLYRVVDGIDLFDPKFNIVSPGADANLYFPYDQHERRLHALHGDIDRMILGDPGDGESRGALAEPDRPLLFTMARLDRIKNLTGLVDWYAQCPNLRERVNLVVFGGYVDPARSLDEEERAQIERMHELFDAHDLDHQVRWLGRRLEKPETGEMYRWIADRRGAFVQPALFEAFGLTVIEAMACGLPTFATRYGGPLEIIEDGVSGFHIDPNHGDRVAEQLAEFFAACDRDPKRWDAISRGGIERVRKRYTWKLHAERLITLSKVYGFWRHVTDLERAETRRYLEMLYALQYRPLAEAIDDAEGA
jgi:sucrose synthase